MKKIIRILFVLFVLNQVTSSRAQEFLRWSEEFNGTSLDTANWEYQIGDGCPDLCGWGNAEAQSYQKKAVTVENGLLKIKATKEKTGNSEYSSGRIRSLNKFDFASGRVEVRARIPQGQGYWPAVWFLPSEFYYGNWPLSGEIDLLECKGQEPKNNYGTIHYGAYAPNNRYSGATYTLSNGSFTEEFHTFTLLWKKDTLQWLVDGVLFSTKTRSTTVDFWWPFDRNFHCLVNLAVGGNFLGYPDASTPDTATFQVDYIRVYQSLDQLFLSGPNSVLRLDKNQKFYTQNLTGASYVWEVPADATIVSGQGTSEVKVNWGLHNDNISVNITYQGNTSKLSKFVPALPDTCEGVIDNVETLRTIYWVGGNGTYKAGITNPSKDAVNGSNSCNRYYRNGGVTYDALVLKSEILKNALPFEQGKLVLKMKLYTTAPIGTEINLNMENRSLSAADYPSGRRCVLQAKTTKTRAWEELTFSLILRPDPSTPEGNIDQLVMLFAPNTSNSDVYFFDDFALLETPCKELAIGVNELGEGFEKMRVFPNPFQETISYKGTWEPKEIHLYNLAGEELVSAQNFSELNALLPSVKQGTYVLRLSDGKQLAHIKIVKIY
jgi:beta-glucanase (GH16 family)